MHLQALWPVSHAPWVALLPENDVNDFIESAESRETSRELMDAILYVAGGNERCADLIWQEPGPGELLAIWERVTKNGLIPSADFCWGASGSDWADGLE